MKEAKKIVLGLILIPLTPFIVVGGFVYDFYAELFGWEQL